MFEFQTETRTRISRIARAPSPVGFYGIELFALCSRSGKRAVGNQRVQAEVDGGRWQRMGIAGQCESRAGRVRVPVERRQSAEFSRGRHDRHIRWVSFTTQDGSSNKHPKPNRLSSFRG